MNDAHDVEVLLRSRIPVIVIETHEEKRAVEMFIPLALRMAKPVFVWSITQGLKRVDIDMPPQKHNIDPDIVIGHIKSSSVPAIYLLLDFHPYLTDPKLVRQLREVAQAREESGDTVVLISHDIDIPPELQKYCAHFSLSMPNEKALRKLVVEEARAWSAKNHGRKVRTDEESMEMLVRNLAGLTLVDARRLARSAICNDGAISKNDIAEVMQAKYKLFDREGVLSFEYDVAHFANVGGLRKLRHWLEQRKSAFTSTQNISGLEKPKGIMLLGVQGCGKSLAARAVAGMWGIPLLRLDFGSLYNKYIGETEKNLRQSLKTARVMAPCVLWIDEIEKGLSSEGGDSGTSRRILGTLLTWMSEENEGVFIVATANDIESLPPELIRKGRLDEIFFVDLPDADTRATVFAVHLKKRSQDVEKFELDKLAQQADNFSGSEIEQAVVSAMYAAHATKTILNSQHILNELKNTRPLAVVMAEKIQQLREWAAGRTVSAD